MTTADETRMSTEAVPADTESLRRLPLRELISEITGRVKLLATTEVELAKAEIRSQVKSEIAMAKGLAIAAACGLLGVNMILVAAAFALAAVVPAWAAALIVAAPLIVLSIVIGTTGWAKRVTRPLEATRASIKVDLEWAKNRLA